MTGGNRPPLRGTAWVFRGLLDVDHEICPFSVVRERDRFGSGDYMYEELGRHCMTTLDPDFPDKVSRGDFLVAEHNTGYGHDHDHAPASIKGAGISAVLCESAGPYFLRNGFDHGLPVLEVPGISSRTTTGDALTVDLARGTVESESTGEILTFEPPPVFLLEMVDAGGLYPLIRQRLPGRLSGPPN